MLKKQLPSVPTTSLPGISSPDMGLPECHIAAHQAPSEGGSGGGQAEQSWSVAEFSGCPAAPDITQMLREPPAAPGSVPPACGGSHLRAQRG